MGMSVFERSIAVTVVLATASSWLLAATLPDPYLWLEKVDSPRALAWVRAENAKTVAVLEKDRRFPGLYQDALAISQAKDRIPAPEFLDGAVFNFWRDAAHVRGIWRRTTFDSYRTDNPEWTAVLDLDVLAAQEKKNWVYSGSVVSPDEKRAIVLLSEGGEDAVTAREFDLDSGTFVTDGFKLPHGKMRVAWEDNNTLLVSREWRPGELTTAGYPFVVKRIRRGQTLDEAHEIFRGTATEGGYAVSPTDLRDGTGHDVLIISRPLTTFEAEYYAVDGAKVAKLDLPRKLSLQTLLDGQLILKLLQDWNVEGQNFKQGALIALDWNQALKAPADLHPVLLYGPGPREEVESAEAMREALLVTGFENVRGRAFVFRRSTTGQWTHDRLDLPDNASVDIVDADIHSNNAFVGVTSFLQPTSLWSITPRGATRIKTLPPKFDASHEVVEQFEATSTDGTHVPYFVVHPAGMKLTGANPTILYAYGGFNISETPGYSATLGKLWLEKGGVYVLANIRGGGEFGPAWHEAGLTTHRQIIYDDFAAVARDLFARRITSARRLGIQGGSNGGLLMGVEFTQHPEMWNAVDIQVPLLDMLRFEKIQAGTSWVGEYGSVSNPGEAAFLAKISPYNNIRRDVHYPLPLIWTTTRDDRVGPQHARKFAARLSEYGIPYLFYEVIEGGHGSGANLTEQAHTYALEMAYFSRQLMD
jgi:prolyl oligopeptidase